MSLPKKMTVKCSKCGAEIEATVFESVNTDYAPDITDRIISGELFDAKCDKCGFVSHVEYDILYHDVKHGAMIWVLHDNSPEYTDKIAELRSSANVLGYKTMRIVNNMNELRQKVACLENGRDDRIIELCKVFIMYDLLSKQPNFEFNNAFYTNYLGQERVFLYDKNGQELSCELTENAYSLLCDMYYNSEYASEFQEYYAIVDYNWAESILPLLLERESKKIDDKNSAKSASVNGSTVTEKKAVCPQCNQTLPGDSLFCHFCGTNIEVPVISAVETIAEPSPVIHTLNHTETAKNSRKKPIIIGVISAVAVALIAILIILFVGNKGGKEIKNVSLRTITFSDEFTAEYVYSTWKNGKATEQSLVELMNKYGAEQGDQGAGRLYFVKPGEYVEEIDEWCFSPKRKIGDCAIIKNAYGYSICYISDINSESDYHIDLTDNNVTNDNFTVTWLSDYRFLYYEDFSKFVLLFELSDEDENTVSAAGTVEIKIVNDDKVIVYDQKRTFSKSNFENWTYDDTVEMYLAAIYIEPKDITAGSTEFGTVYFTVYGDDYNFEECSITAFDLPRKSSTSQSQGSANANPNSNTNSNANTNDKTEDSSNKITCLSIYCENAVVKSGDYCSEHRCQNGDCGYEREPNSNYCSACLCGTSGCLKVQVKNGYYCEDHTCSEPKCQYNKSADEKYCSYHACDICGELRLSTSLYCAEHN